MGAEVIMLANPYTYNFLKGLTHSAMQLSFSKNGKIEILPDTHNRFFWLQMTHFWQILKKTQIL